MSHTIHDIGVAKQIAAYSDSIEVKGNVRRLFSSGTPGLAINGDLPSDITGQAEIAWKHVIDLLEQADMGVADIVTVTQISDARRRHPGLWKGPNAIPWRASSGLHAPHNSATV